jgi:hypothetical protein
LAFRHRPPRYCYGGSTIHTGGGVWELEKASPNSPTHHRFLFFIYFLNLWAQVNTWASKVLRYLYPGFDITRAKFIVSIIRRLPNPSHRRLCVQTITGRDKTSWKSSLTQWPQPHQKTKKGSLIRTHWMETANPNNNHHRRAVYNLAW